MGSVLGALRCYAGSGTQRYGQHCFFCTDWTSPQGNIEGTSPYEG